MAKIITVLSGKGGTGKTLFAVNLGAYLALQGKKVLIFDADFHSRAVDLALELESRVIYDIVDVINGDCRIKQALVKSRRYEGLYIMEPPILSKKGEISLLEIEVLLGRLKPDFDYIILDTTGGLSSAAESFGKMSDQVLLVTTQEPAAVRTGQSLISMLKDEGVKDISIVINKVKMKLSDEGYFLDVEDIAEELGVGVCGVIPEDENMNVAYNNGQVIVDIENSAAAEHLNRVISRFLLT